MNETLSQTSTLIQIYGSFMKIEAKQTEIIWLEYEKGIFI